MVSSELFYSYRAKRHYRKPGARRETRTLMRQFSMIVSDVLYADWHNSKVGVSFCLDADGVLSAGYFLLLTLQMGC